MTGASAELDRWFPVAPPTATPLRAVLALNATFSASWGTELLLHAKRWSEVFSGLYEGWLHGIGGALLGFAALVLRQAARQRPGTLWTVAITIADLSWVLGTGVVLWVFGGGLSSVAVSWLCGVAAAVMSLAVLETWALGKALTNPRTGMQRFQLEVPADVSPARGWSAIADLGTIVRHAPMLRRVELRGDAGEGCTRVCTSTAGKTWAETVIGWEPPRRFVLRFESERQGFPFPVRRMFGGWSVEAAGSGCQVRVFWEYLPKGGWVGLLIVAALYELSVPRSFKPIITAMVAGTPNAAARGEGSAVETAV